MKISIETRNAKEIAADLLALPLVEQPRTKWKLPGRIAALDRAVRGQLAAALASGDFRGKRGETHLVYSGGALKAKRLLLVGLGDEAQLNSEALRRAAGVAMRSAAARDAKKLALLAPTTRKLGAATAAQALAEGVVLASYRFDRHRSKRKDDPGTVTQTQLVFERAQDRKAAREAAEHGRIIAESQNLARDLSNAPGNELPPAALARAAQRAAKEAGLRFQAMDVPALKRRKMGGILAVGQGSCNPPRLIVMEHGAPRGATKRSRRPTVCLVGKGITFDSGGISLKPGAAMDEMKHDMSGAAAVVGAMRAIGKLKLPVRVVGIIPAAENLPSDTAYRPGDVVKTMSGKTIEVLNTDAEGRVVLSDALYYACTEFEPAAVVDLATLTGACVIALGPWASGMLGNNERLAERVQKAGEAAGERVWPLPLWDEHRDHIRSQVADIKNTGGREAGTITAGAFLSHFVEGTPWVHLDIAATAWTKKSNAYQKPGATGVGVRLLVELIRSWRVSL